MKRGRKSLLSEALTRRICALLHEGVSIATAANLCGVSERVYHTWMTRGNSEEEPYASFFDAASRARDSWKARLLKKVERSKDWRAAAWLLEKQFPAEFGPKIEAMPERPDSGLTIVYEMTPEQVQASGASHAKRIREMPNPPAELAQKLARYESGEQGVFNDELPILDFPMDEGVLDDKPKPNHSALGGRIQPHWKKDASK